MKKRVAKKILQDKEKLNYKESQIKKAEKIMSKYSKTEQQKNKN